MCLLYRRLMSKKDLTWPQFLSEYAKEFPGQSLLKRAGAGWKRYQTGLSSQTGGYLEDPRYRDEIEEDPRYKDPRYRYGVKLNRGEIEREFTKFRRPVLRREVGRLGKGKIALTRGELTGERLEQLLETQRPLLEQQVQDLSSADFHRRQVHLMDLEDQERLTPFQELELELLRKRRAERLSNVNQTRRFESRPRARSVF